MKRIAIIILAVSAILTGCKKEVINTPEGTGTVQLQLKGNAGEYTDVTVKSENAQVDVNTFKVSIKSKEGSYSKEWASFAEVPAMLELSSGEYTITASSPENSESKWGVPVYTGSQDFLVEINRVSNVEVVCSISNVKVSIRCSEKFTSELSDYEITVQGGNGSSLVWTKSDVEADQSGFFPVASLDVRVKGYRALNNKEATYHLSIDDVEAGNHYILNLDAQTTGEAGFQIAIDDSLADQDVNIDVPGFDEIPVEGGDDEEGGAEEPDTPTDPETPAITMKWPSNPSFERMQIKNGMDVNLTISAPAGIKTFVVTVDSPVLNSMLPAVAGSTEMDLINSEQVKGFLSGLGLPTGDQLAGQTSVQFPLSNLVPMILSLSPEAGSEHNFTLAISDSNDASFSKTLTFYVAE